MLSTKFARTIRTFLSHLEINARLLNVLKALSNSYDALLGQLLVTLRAGAHPDTHNKNEEAKEKIRQSLEPVKKLRLWEVTEDFRLLQEHLDQVYRQLGEGNKLEQYHQAIQSFKDSHQALVESTFHVTAAMPLFSAAKILYSMLLSDRELLQLISNCVDPAVAELRDGETQLRIEIEDGPDRDPCESIREIQSIYTVTANMLGISTADFPLRFIRIEIGSFFCSVIGSAVVLGAISVILKACIAYIRFHYTEQGKWDKLHRDTRQIAEIVELHKLLKDQGIEVPQTDEHIRQAFSQLTASLGRLTLNARRIRINDVAIEAGGDIAEHLIKASVAALSQKLLGESKGTD